MAFRRTVHKYNSFVMLRLVDTLYRIRWPYRLTGLRMKKSFNLKHLDFYSNTKDFSKKTSGQLGKLYVFVIKINKNSKNDILLKTTTCILTNYFIAVTMSCKGKAHHNKYIYRTLNQPAIKYWSDFTNSI